MLLPKPKEDIQEQDPRSELIYRLQEYQRFKEVSEKLDEIPRLNRDFFSASAKLPEFQVESPLVDLSLEDLSITLAEVMQRVEQSKSHLINLEQLSTRERMTQILERMKEVDNKSIAVKGVCQTGRHPLIIAARKKIAAALVWYGAAQDREWESNELYKEPLADVIEKIDCPVLGVFGEADHMISLDHVRRFRNCFEEKRKTS